MDQYIFLLTIIGIASFAMTWMPDFTARTGISYAILYVAAGALIYWLVPGPLPVPLPTAHPDAALHLTEMVVLISLMGTGIKIDRPFTLKNWATPLKLISFAMIACIAVAACTGHYLLGLSIPASILLGSVLAPTDPVLASDVQVGPPNQGMKSETRFSLTAEAGLNDGMAFPFIWLAITLTLMAGGSDHSLWNWLAVDLGYKLVAGALIGLIIGRLVGYLLFTLSRKYTALRTHDGFLAIALTLMVYGLTELVHAYGFIAVFITAITLRHYEKEDDYHHELHTVTEQMERLLVAVLLLLFGGALVSGILDALTWRGVLFSLLFLLVIRPLVVMITLASAKFHIKEKLAIGFFGIRGMGSLFYLSFALGYTEFEHAGELWSIVAFTMLVSVLIHGVTATRIMNHLKRELPKEETPGK